MSVQDTYSENMDALRLGFIYDTSNKDLISRTCEGAVIGFGQAVVQGAADRGARATTTGDTKIIGITCLERSAIDGQYAVGDSMRVITQGPVVVMAAAAVAAGDPVHVIVADGTFSNTLGVVIENAFYESSGAIGDLVKVRIA